jgi:hypothetical protein
LYVHRAETVNIELLGNEANELGFGSEVGHQGVNLDSGKGDECTSEDVDSCCDLQAIHPLVDVCKFYITKLEIFQNDKANLRTRYLSVKEKIKRDTRRIFGF